MSNNKAIRDGEKVAKKSIFHLMILATIKFVIGFITGLPVLIADGISTIADTLGVFASYFGLKLSRKSADKHFEYGYYKFETFAALVVSLGIVTLSILVFLDGIETFQNPSEGQFQILAILATLTAIFHSHRLAKELKEAGERTNSLSLLANARDKKVDVFAGIAILISVVANYYEIAYIEGIVTIFISLIIFKEGILSSKESLFFLLDYWNNPKLQRKIRKILREDKGLVLEVKKLRLRRAGTFVFGEAFLEINPFAGLQDLRDELDILQNKIQELDPYIKDFAIYTHIAKSRKVKVALPIKSGKDLHAKLALSLKETSAYLFADLHNGEVQEFKIENITKDQKKTIALTKFLMDRKIDILIDNDLNSLTYYYLRRTHHILIYPNFSDVDNVKQTLELLLIDT